MFMSGIRFTKEQQSLLSKNPSVTKVTEKSITYSETFKISGFVDSECSFIYTE